jgi:hypothetical protein
VEFKLTTDVREIPATVETNDAVLIYPALPRPVILDATFVGLLTYPKEPSPWTVDVSVAVLI